MNGFVFLNKPQDITSFVAAARVKRIFGEKKAGHTGTLDPMATGVMVVALGNATRFIELISDHNKAYKAKFQLGVTTDTLDSTGTVLEKKDGYIEKERLVRTLEKFKGTIEQIPPMYSAIKKDGIRLYELARRGEQISRDSREIIIYDLQLLSYDEETKQGELYVACSSGTYIRSLINDIGNELSVGGIMTALERTKANGVSIEECRTLEELSMMQENNTLSMALVPIEKFLGFPLQKVSEAQAKRFSNGGQLDLKRLKTAKENALLSVVSPDGLFLGVGFSDMESGELRAKKIMSK